MFWLLVFFTIFTSMVVIGLWYFLFTSGVEYHVVEKPNGRHEIVVRDIIGRVRTYCFTGEHYVERLAFKKVSSRKQRQLTAYLKESSHV